MDNTKHINAVEWFFGYGGNHLGIKRVLPNLRLVAACEIEAYAVANYTSKMEEGRLDSCPTWTDCKTFPTKPFKNRELDLFIASYPCQPFSAAGKRKGANDPRHLWPYVKKFIEEVRPRLCFFENVEGHISLGLREVLADLANLGYRMENDCGEPTWGLFSANEVGAPHQRKRVFIMAYTRDSRPGGIFGKIRCEAGSEILRQKDGEKCTIRFDSTGSNTELANPRSPKLNQIPEPEKREENGEVRNSGQELAHSRCSASPKGKQSSKLRTTGISEPSRSPRLCGNTRKNEKIGQKWPARPGEPQYEWEEPRTTKPIMGRAVNESGSRMDPNRNRIDRLRLLGNGVVPATAELAFRTLLNRIINPEEKQPSIQLELFKE